MSKQLELLARSGLVVQPEANRSEPRLWIRRLVIWSEPGEILREITLRPGLNIVWAPDPTDQPAESEDHAIPGHGSGKTLLCRLLRYCLGESRFAPQEQREKIIAAFPNGLVGAEIMVDGTQWAVVRPIGTSRKHFASDDVAVLVPGDDRLNSWLVALAWLARDQECRFNRPLDWRSADSDSGSPVRQLSAQQHLDALRALTGALNPDETKLRADTAEIETQRNWAQREAEQQGREADRLRARLIGQLYQGADDLPPGRMAIEPLRKAAIHQLATLSQGHPSDNHADVERLRTEADQARGHLEDLKRRLAAVKSRIPVLTKLVTRIKGEIPGASAQAAAAGEPVCEICEVPIDRALADGCRLSHKLPDLDAAKRRIERLEQQHTEESNRLQSALTERAGLIKELHPAQRDHDSATKSPREVERVRDARTDRWYESRRLIDEVDRLDDLLIEQERTQVRIGELEYRIQEKRDQTGSFREAHPTTFHRLSHFFDAIPRIARAGCDWPSVPRRERYQTVSRVRRRAIDRCHRLPQSDRVRSGGHVHEHRGKGPPTGIPHTRQSPRSRPRTQHLPPVVRGSKRNRANGRDAYVSIHHYHNDKPAIPAERRYVVGHRPRWQDSGKVAGTRSLKPEYETKMRRKHL